MNDETKNEFTPGACTLTGLEYARLIKAAPDLLAALVLCVEDYERGMIETDAWQMLHIGKVERPPTPIHIMAARAAIAKAREG